MNILAHLDLLSVGLIIAATAVLGFVIYFSDRKSITNRTFFYFSLVTIVWSICNFFSYQSSNPYSSVTLIRLTIFSSVFHALFFYELFRVFPEREYAFSSRYNYILVPAVIGIAFLTLTPLVFVKVIPTSGIVQVKAGPLIPLYGLTVCFLIVRGFIVLIKKIKKATGERYVQLRTIFIGTICTFTLLITFNFLFPAFLNNSTMVPFGAIFIFPFVVAVSRAIFRHKLFNVKVVSTAALVFAIVFILFAEIIFSDTLAIILFRSSIFVLTLIFGINLIRSVIREVEQRERIQELVNQLQTANEGQSNLIHIINHQIKGYLSKARNIFSEFMGPDGMYASQVTGQAQQLSGQGFEVLTDGVRFVQSVLNASSIEKGTIQYDKQKFDLKPIVDEVANAMQKIAERKGLQFGYTAESGEYMITGDRLQLKEVFTNIFDNAIKYTQTGSITGMLKRENQKIVFQVIDTGVGVNPEDRAKLFTRGGRGKNSTRINVDSTGYGLYFVKGVIEAHQGTVTLDSDGEGKGSTCTVTLPIA